MLSEHPSVRLERLAWTVNGEAAPALDARFVGAASVAPRAIEAMVPSGVRLELAGRIAASGASGAAPLSVGERQRRFEAFVATLRERAGVERPHVALSPATAASRDDAGGDGLDYELAFDHPAPVPPG